MTARTYTALPDGTIAIALSDEVTVFAAPLEDFPIGGIYMSWAQGAIYLRYRFLGDGRGQIRDVTEAVLRYSLARLRRSKGRQAKAKGAQRARIRKGAEYTPKTGSPTPERRKRALDEGSAVQLVASPDAPSATLYQVPSHLLRMHRNGKITSNMLHAASKFHRDYVAAGMVGVRLARLIRVEGGAGPDGLNGAVLDARARLHKICDGLGGFNQPGFQVLLGVVGELRTVSDWSSGETRGPWRLNHESGRGVLITALGALEGFYRPAGGG